MERLQFYPGEENPKGKNYIFFAAHPEDRDVYFESLRKEILQIEENCVFWYDTAPEQPWDESVTDTLAGIQLFLFPVTAKLLTTKNIALDVLLPYASKEQIAIMPILMEPGLDELYRQVFADRQYLDRVTQDITAIPYGEKLKNYLRNVLVSKETAEKIRAAFDAYIFLSYRKKDRVLASKLMRLIHEIPQMRDVAIWYDEFLVPGEDFNANIAQALEKSDLFTMAVTPNLVVEDNYVLKTEYPEARKADKPILAAQVADTDPVAFHNCFEDIPGSINAHNSEELKQALLDAFSKLRHITLAQNSDPMHTYLIGLAYLNGIDVERNADRALALITAAAEGACLDAMECLAGIYMFGTSRQRNDDLSIHWQQEATNRWREKCRNSASAEDRLHLADSLLQLGLRRQSQEQIDAAIACYEEAEKEYRFCTLDKECVRDAAENLRVTQTLLSTACLRKSDNDRVIRYESEMIGQLASVPAENLTLTQKKRLALAYCNAAQAEESNGNTPDAAALHRCALNLCENKEGRENLRRELGYIYLAVGEQYLKHEGYLYECDDAADHFWEAEELFKSCLRESPNQQDRLGLCDAQLGLGITFTQGQSFDFCERKLHAALTNASIVASSMSWPLVKNRIYACHVRLSNLYRAWGKIDQAQDHAAQAFSYSEDRAEPSKSSKHTQKKKK